mmetsp:Transcript_55806/g.155596  ORF Transcript_55806/g.155596 Transcript_55806/m.155596 type:complete len:459 (+) Transcript_55806:218-1594(+)
MRTSSQIRSSASACIAAPTPPSASTASPRSSRASRTTSPKLSPFGASRAACKAHTASSQRCRWRRTKRSCTRRASGRSSCEARPTSFICSMAFRKRSWQLFDNASSSATTAALSFASFSCWSCISSCSFAARSSASLSAASPALLRPAIGEVSEAAALRRSATVLLRSFFFLPCLSRGTGAGQSRAFGVGQSLSCKLIAQRPRCAARAGESVRGLRPKRAFAPNGEARTALTFGALQCRRGGFITSMTAPSASAPPLQLPSKRVVNSHAPLDRKASASKGSRAKCSISSSTHSTTSLRVAAPISVHQHSTAFVRWPSCSLRSQASVAATRAAESGGGGEGALQSHPWSQHMEAVSIASCSFFLDPAACPRSSAWVSPHSSAADVSQPSCLVSTPACSHAAASRPPKRQFSGRADRHTSSPKAASTSGVARLAFPSPARCRVSASTPVSASGRMSISTA